MEYPFLALPRADAHRSKYKHTKERKQKKTTNSRIKRRPLRGRGAQAVIQNQSAWWLQKRRGGPQRNTKRLNSVTTRQSSPEHAQRNGVGHRIAIRGESIGWAPFVGAAASRL